MVHLSSSLTLNNPDLNIAADIASVARIAIIPSILDVVCRTTGMGFAAVARVTETKWVACAVKDDISFGLVPGGELQLESTICHEIRQSGKLVVIDHVEEDPFFCKHATPLQYGFQSYISVPIKLKDGRFFGTLCCIDPRPAQLNNPQIIGMFTLFADLISFHLHAIDQLDLAEQSLREERKVAELRDQFIAVLGHDLRNPVSAISNSAQLMLRMSIGEDVSRLAGIIKNSSYRMAGMIENILDFAQGKMGGGIVLHAALDSQPERTVQQVVSELQSVYPDRQIETFFKINGPVFCDQVRIAQLFANLLTNALKYGKPDAPVKVKLETIIGEYRLEVSNACDKISDAVLARIFQPFSRGEVSPGKQGLGLGLYIASEIARIHNGTIGIESTDTEVTFTFSMPSAIAQS